MLNENHWHLGERKNFGVKLPAKNATSVLMPPGEYEQGSLTIPLFVDKLLCF